ncbi:sodium channel protein type 11 subunit alpha [Caerostris extrusa]|uniref:Sodium channel protein type 11 subunit alpha n=1 Tax=Caerostris extrusa TaxID=172846 RepID=A0AAV4VFK7_CAEEX|nr:sodium channel protein type 11 subunit alpha [Caerostris extrusa]
MFAIIGNRVLGPLYADSVIEEDLRWSFETFDDSLFMVFFWIFTGEYIDSLWNCMSKTNSSVLCPVVFISYFLIGNLVIVSLFTALLLNSFEDSDLYPKRKPSVKHYWTLIRFYVYEKFLKGKKMSKKEINEDERSSKIERGKLTNRCDTQKNKINVLIRIKRFIRGDKFELIVNIVIIASCISLALDNSKVESNSELHKTLILLNYVFTGLFLLEMLLKWFGFGFINYFTNVWTLFDFAINLVAVLEILYGIIMHLGHEVSGLTVLRALKSIKLLSKWHGMKMCK